MAIIPLQQNETENKVSKRRKERIDALAVLPVFFKLKDKNVLLAGGSDAGAWKAELLWASGAIVHIYTPELSAEFQEIYENAKSSQNPMIWHERPWATDSFEHMEIAIGDMETEGAGQAFYCAAKAAGIAVNVIDQPEFCMFQFGSIVNRSPIVVGISTNGAAPIFGQAIRRRIETLLPASIQDWAKKAEEVRPFVNEALDFGRPRRIFWEKFVDLAFTKSISSPLEYLKKLIHNVENDKSSTDGKVTLVGAGPGDPELLTLKAVRALQAADVILYDDLVSGEVLELARREAKRLLVGKRGGRESCRQEDINDMMVKLAKAGKNVVRLKSGDPSVFGRSGEEMAWLRAQNIDVHVVPGITAASAMAERLGISLTHRDHAQSLRLTTGHSKKGDLPHEVDWSAIADTTTTNIFYMGGRTAPKIREQLLANGLPAHTPVAIMSAITRDEEKHWFGILDHLEQGVEELGIDQPILIGVGNIFSMVQKRQQEKLDNQSIV